MITLVHTKRFWVKMIRVLPQHRTSKQYHRERWERQIKLWPSSHTLILPMQVHRMGPGVHFEIAGGFPDEDDVVRIEDDYGRT